MEHTWEMVHETILKVCPAQERHQVIQRLSAEIQPRLAREVPYMTCWLASSLAEAARYRIFVMQRMKSWARSSRLVDEPEEPRSMQRLRCQGKKLYVSFVSHSYVTGLILCIFHQAASKNQVAGRAYRALGLPWGVSSSGWSFSPGLPTNWPCALALVLAGLISA